MKDIEKFREGAETLRKTADLFDKCADLMEDEKLSENEKEEAFETIVGKIMFLSIKAQSVFE